MFQENLSPIEILKKLEIISKKKIIPGETLIFLDEVQLCPNAIKSLRYFYEKMPAIHIIAAGSLIGFALDNISIPVGRVVFKHLTPLSFQEYLINTDNIILYEYLMNHKYKESFEASIHEKATRLFKQYVSYGGMPEVLSEESNYSQEEILGNLLEAYRQDFPKYTQKNKELKYTQLVFEQIPRLIAKQFKFTQISREVKAVHLRDSIELLKKANVINLIYSTSAVDPLLGMRLDRYKLLYLDVGLMQKSCKMDFKEWLDPNSLMLINKGAIAEQVVGQEIIANSNYKRPQLFYWERSKKGSSAEIDYILELNTGVFPVEVKSDSPGTLKSMQLFLEKYPQCKQGLRVSGLNLDNQKNLLSLPAYAFGTWLRKHLYMQ